MKSFRRRDAESNYEKESKAFGHITRGGTRSAAGLIGFYGGFEYRNTFNLILEWAERGTLEDFFHHDDIPSTGSEILALWTSVLETVKGLGVIHEQQVSQEQSPNGPRKAFSLQG